MRLAIANTLGNRDSSTDKDERILNGLAEKIDDKRAYVVKRPGFVSTYSIATGQGGATQGQGLFVMNLPGTPGVLASNTLIGIRGDALTIPL